MTELSQMSRRGPHAEEMLVYYASAGHGHDALLGHCREALFGATVVATGRLFTYRSS